MHKVKIRIVGGRATGGSVEIDGNPIKCSRVEFTADVHSTPTVILELIPSEVEIETDCTVLQSTTSIGDEWKTFKPFMGGK